MPDNNDMPEGLEKPHPAEITGAMRASIDTKIDTSLVPYELVCAAAIAFNYGAQKYDDRNFEKGLSYRSLCGSIERHNSAILAGEELDEDSGLPHFAMLAASIGMLCHNIMQNVVIDNRPAAKAGVNIANIAQMAQNFQKAGKL